jgi:hypothetical protein
MKAKRGKGFVNNAVGMQHRNLADRIRAFKHYGGLRCICCGEDEFSFLSLDHVSGAGNIERAKLFGDRYQGGHHIYRALRLQGYPSGYQVLCMNCQVGRRDNGGICPHQSRRLNGEELLLEFEKLRVGQGNIEATQTETYIMAFANVMRKGKAVTPWGFINGPKRKRQILEDQARHRDKIEISSDGADLPIEKESQE